MERLELELSSLTTTVSRVEINQAHAEELNKLRFSALDTSVSNLAADLKGFMARIEGMLDGSVQTTAGRQGQELVADYQKWRREVDADRAKIAAAKLEQLDEDREQFAVLDGRLNLIGKLLVVTLGSSAFAIIGVLYALTGNPVP